jgi:trk system potassium uptake protein TrkH
VNFRIVLRLLGLLLSFIGLTMSFALFWSLYYHDGSALSLLISLALTIGAGGLLVGLGRFRKEELFRKEALAVVGLSWLLVPAFGALPFVFSHTVPTYVDAYFEAMSGFTTTGSTVLPNIESATPGILFWRSFTHWLGGMGIIVLFIAVLPFLGAGGRRLFRSEVSGPVSRGLTPRITETALILWKIYILLSAIETLLLMVCGMSLFDALCHTFGTMATGGFSTKNASIGYYRSLPVDLIIIVFMFLAGTNFALHYRLLKGAKLSHFRDVEWKAYVAILFFSVIFISGHLWVHQVYGTIGETLRRGAFQVVSIMTTTGFTTADFNLWPPGAKGLLVVLMFIGGCAGSTGGGMKVVRIVMLLKIARFHVEKIYSPRTIRKVRLGGVVVEDEAIVATLSFFFLFILVFVIASLVVLALGLDLVTGVSAVAATLNNIGPGLEKVGAIEHYAHVPEIGKVVLSLCMAMGRLELFSILILFVPMFWQRK